MSKSSKLQLALTAGTQNQLQAPDILFLEMLELEYKLSLQDLRTVALILADSQSWNAPMLDVARDTLQELGQEHPKWQKRQLAAQMITRLQAGYEVLKAQPKQYQEQQAASKQVPQFTYEEYALSSSFFHVCPAKTRSQEGLCCDLQVLDVVENCALGCSYCILQNRFEEPEIRVPNNLRERLDEIVLDPNKQIRIGTGQSSDSLLWGNQNGMLQDLLDFTAKNPQIILELKTKSANTKALEELQLPANLCVSWSINAPEVIRYEERGTPSLQARLQAARRLANKGVKLGFHLHPMMYFEGWQASYTQMIHLIRGMFDPQEILWFTLGTVTLPKGLDETVRAHWSHSKLLQMQTELTPDGKVTYAKEVRLAMYSHVLAQMGSWREQICTYLCMEFRDVWQQVLGYEHPDHDAFNQWIMDSAFSKIFPNKAS
jgi:spore photoproduct lyase